MHPAPIIRRLSTFPRGLAAIVEGLTPDEARWRPPSGHWSVLEIVCHLCDEEELDFRARVLSTLEDPTRPWPKIDPEALAMQNRYNEQDLGRSLARFTAARGESIEKLHALAGGDVDKLAWTNAYLHPKVGPVPAGELLAAWAAHDALHLRQIAKRMWELAARDGAPHKLTYAGEWKA